MSEPKPATERLRDHETIEAYGRPRAEVEKLRREAQPSTAPLPKQEPWSTTVHGLGMIPVRKPETDDSIEKRIKVLEACHKRWKELGETECAAIYQGAAFELRLFKDQSQEDKRLIEILNNRWLARLEKREEALHKALDAFEAIMAERHLTTCEPQDHPASLATMAAAAIKALGIGGAE